MSSSSYVDNSSDEDMAELDSTRQTISPKQTNGSKDSNTFNLQLNPTDKTTTLQLNQLNQLNPTESKTLTKKRKKYKSKLSGLSEEEKAARRVEQLKAWRQKRAEDLKQYRREYYKANRDKFVKRGKLQRTAYQLAKKQGLIPELDKLISPVC
jgi:hypothetical protein